MRSQFVVAALALVVTVTPTLVGAETSATGGAFRSITVEQLAALRSTNAAIVVDANGMDTRQKYGVIPGAVLLSNYDHYDVTKELPHDSSRTLVFYCANERCMASHKAAQHAIDAGYANVSILPAGIMGWRNAGQPTAPAGS